MARANHHCNRRTFFGAEAFPIWNFGYPGRENIPVFLGCPVTLAKDTGWVDAILTGEGLDLSELTIAPDNPWWNFTLGALEWSAREAEGKAIPATGAFGGAGDSLAWLRGTERLLMDCAERPEQVRAAEQWLMELWCGTFDRFHGILRQAREGSAGWFPLWSPGKFYATQCDFAYMISPKMFRSLFLPVIERQTRFLDHAIHHVDGEGNFAHVDALCELPRLQAIQILPGAGKPSPLHYLPVLKKVQAAGKNLHIGIRAAEVKEALELLSAKGLFIHTYCDTEEEARSLIRNAAKWSKER
jgi:hypothetical protein